MTYQKGKEHQTFPAQNDHVLHFLKLGISQQLRLFSIWNNYIKKVFRVFQVVIQHTYRTYNSIKCMCNKSSLRLLFTSCAISNIPFPLVILTSHQPMGACCFAGDNRTIFIMSNSILSRNLKIFASCGCKTKMKFSHS